MINYMDTYHTSINCNCDDRGIKDMEIFEKWRESTINKYNTICYQRINNIIKLNQKEEINLKNIPRCMVKLTRSMCKCNRDCASDSYFKMKFDLSCLIYDMNDLYIDINYVDCQFLDYKIVDNYMVPSAIGNYLTNSRIRFYKEISKFCKTPNYAFDNIQCAAYELRDACNDNKLCLEISLNANFPENCVNDEFQNMINDLSTIMYIPYTSLEYIRNKRSINIFENKEYNVTTENCSINYNKIYGYSSISLASSLILLMLGREMHNNKSSNFSTKLIGLFTSIIFVLSIMLTINQLQF